MSATPNTIQHLDSFTPAYGRDYKSAAEVTEAFLAGKDFKHAFTGLYASIRDVPKGSSVVLRYAQQARWVVVKVP